MSSKQRSSFLKARIEIIVDVIIAFAIIVCAVIVIVIAISVRIRIDERCLLFVSVTVHRNIFVRIASSLIIVAITEIAMNLDAFIELDRVLIVFEFQSCVEH